MTAECRPRRAGLYLVLGTLIALLMTTYRYLDEVAEGNGGHLLDVAINEFTGVFGAVLLLPVMVGLVRRFPLTRDLWARHLPVHLGALAGLSFVHTSSNWGSRTLLFALAGIGPYDYGAMPVRYLMEAPIDVIIYSLAFVITGLFDRYAAARARELRLLRVEGQLVEARLDRLRGQLHPHFLFNTLHTVSAVMYEDVERADRMLARLGEMLRWTLEDGRGPEVPLAEELALLERYLEIMRERHGDGLVATVVAPSELLPHPVPALLLQPLVENALRHGAASNGAPLRVEVAARRRDDRLELEVRDHGAGFDGGLDDAMAHGIGLRNTVERLRELYGAAGELALGHPRGGGLSVTVRVPWREAAATSRRTSEAARPAVVGAPPA